MFEPLAAGDQLRWNSHFLKRITHFDRERIPEQVVHARSADAHALFKVENFTFTQVRSPLLKQLQVHFGGSCVFLMPFLRSRVPIHVHIGRLVVKSGLSANERIIHSHFNRLRSGL
ncbi:catalase [Paenibacillus xylanilyticus]|uniref:catalase n=1 Tax=Paenibacillus xylanilyticus TaxID=248903 RepID=UPI0035E405A2